MGRDRVKRQVGAVRLAIQRGGDAVHCGDDAHRRLYLLGGQAGFAQDFLMAVDADATAIDGLHRQAPQLKIHLVDAGLGDDVHAQSRRQDLVVRR